MKMFLKPFAMHLSYFTSSHSVVGNALTRHGLIYLLERVSHGGVKELFRYNVK